MKIEGRVCRMSELTESELAGILPDPQELLKKLTMEGPLWKFILEKLEEKKNEKT